MKSINTLMNLLFLVNVDNEEYFIAFVLFNIATLLRVIGPSFVYTTAMWLAALAWSLAFVQFAWVYGPMLCKTRVDGHPG